MTLATDLMTAAQAAAEELDRLAGVVSDQDATIDALRAEVQRLTPRAGLGVYGGTPSAKSDPDAVTMRQFGHVPDVANSYYQPGQPTLYTSGEIARLKVGTSPNVTLTAKGTTYVEGIAAGRADALAWLETYVDALRIVSEAVPDGPPVYATLCHEFRAQVAAGHLTGASADPVVYGRALGVLYRLLAERAPRVVGTYWMVGYVGPGPDEAVPPQHFGDFGPGAWLFDPYAKAADATIASITRGDVARIKSWAAYHGEPIALGEFGMPVKYGDAALGTFYAALRKALAEAGISWGVFFNRARDNDHQIAGRADGRTFPAAVAAFADSLGA